jgi:threonyl-tRNA synthetase
LVRTADCGVAHRHTATAELGPDWVNPEIKKAQLMKVPYMLVVGDREMGNDTVAMRKRIGVQAKDIPLEEFIADLRERIVSRSAGL